jgi:hypothetical protein
MPLPVTITELPFGPEVLRIELVKLHDAPMFSARRYFKNAAGQPGRMGLTFAIERLPEVTAGWKMHSIELAKNDCCHECGNSWSATLTRFSEEN